MPETETLPAYLIFSSTHPDDGPMLFVEGRAGVEQALATQLCYSYGALDEMSEDHRDELAALMEQFDDPDEWSGCQFMWSFEDGGVCVVRLAPEALAAWNRRIPSTASSTLEAAAAKLDARARRLRGGDDALLATEAETCATIIRSLTPKDKEGKTDARD